MAKAIGHVKRGSEDAVESIRERCSLIVTGAGPHEPFHIASSGSKQRLLTVIAVGGANPWSAPRPLDVVRRSRGPRKWGRMWSWEARRSLAASVG